MLAAAVVYKNPTKQPADLHTLKEQRIDNSKKLEKISGTVVLRCQSVLRYCGKDER